MRERKKRTERERGERERGERERERERGGESIKKKSKKGNLTYSSREKIRLN